MTSYRYDSRSQTPASSSGTFSDIAPPRGLSQAHDWSDSSNRQPQGSSRDSAPPARVFHPPSYQTGGQFVPLESGRQHDPPAVAGGDFRAALPGNHGPTDHPYALPTFYGAAAAAPATPFGGAAATPTTLYGATAAAPTTFYGNTTVTPSTHYGIRLDGDQIPPSKHSGNYGRHEDPSHQAINYVMNELQMLRRQVCALEEAVLHIQRQFVDLRTNQVDPTPRFACDIPCPSQ